MKILKITQSSDIDRRIDAFLAENTDITRSQIQKMLENGDISVCGKVVRKNYKLCLDDEITVNDITPVECEAKAQSIPLDVVYEDSDVIIINKPKGMVVHPAAGNYDNTLVNALLYHCGDNLSGIGGVIRPGIVHRIDKDTSGLLLVAKNDKAHLSLSEQIKIHSAKRIYRAIALGKFSESEGTVDKPIGRSQKDRKKMAVTDKNSKNAVTHYKVLKQFKDCAYIECSLETGRTHQIRVHMAHIGHPLLKDYVYGQKSQMEKRFSLDFEGQCLHAVSIIFKHPSTDEIMKIDGEMPEYFTELLKKLDTEQN